MKKTTSLFMLALAAYGVAQAADIPARKAQKFSFALIADPQVAAEKSGNTVFRHAARTFAEACREINNHREIAFTLSLGDIVNVYEPRSVENFVNIAKTLQKPLYLVHGNHDSRFPYTEYKEMSKELTGIDEMYYSFDAGDWHFIILPSQIDTTPTLMKDEKLAKWMIDTGDYIQTGYAMYIERERKTKK